MSEECAYVLRKAGFNLISDIRDAQAQGIHQKIGENNKKEKLGYETPHVHDNHTRPTAATQLEDKTKEHTN